MWDSDIIKVSWFPGHIRVANFKGSEIKMKNKQKTQIDWIANKQNVSGESIKSIATES